MRGAVVGAVLLLTGCGGAAPAASSSPSPSLSPSPSAVPTTSVAALPQVPGLEAEAVQLRSDVTIGGQVQVRITDTGTEPFTVTSVQLDSPGFAQLPPKSLHARYDPGRTIDLTTPFGDVRCAARVDPVTARVTVVRPDGRAEDLTLPLAGGTMGKIHGEQCAVEGLLAAVDVAVSDLVPAGDTLGADVVLTRRGTDADVVVSALRASVVLEPVPGRRLPVTMAAGERSLRLPVTFDAERCDPHALADVKQPFRFPMTVTVGDGEPVPVDLPFTDEQERQLQELLGRVCAD